MQCNFYAVENVYHLVRFYDETNGEVIPFLARKGSITIVCTNPFWASQYLASK